MMAGEQSVLNAVPCGIVTFDDNGTVLAVNSTLLQWLSVTSEALLGKSLEALFPPGGRIFLQTHFLPLLHGGEGVREVYFALRTGSGEELPVLLNASREVQPDGKGVSVAAFLSMSSRQQFEDVLLRALKSEHEAGQVLEAQNQELLRIERSLTRASAAKDEFLGLVSHELRSPLAAMSGAVSLLRRRMDELDEPTRLELLADVERECARLLSLVGDMLIVARAELTQAVDLEPVLLQRVVPSVVDRTSAKFESSSVTLTVEPDLPAVEANPGFVEQITTNFLTNAYKYGAVGSPIEVLVAATESGDAVEVTVLNTGDELEAERVARFFEPFYREERGPARTGLGLGLSVCLRLAEAQGGTVRAKPRQGGGLEITLALPALRLDA